MIKINLADVPLRDHSHGDSFEARLGRIGPLIGAKDLGCQLHIVPPGKKAFPFHAHHNNEEMFFVLKGHGEYRFGAQRVDVHEGDILGAPCGDAGMARQIINTGGDDLHYLAFSTRNDPDVIEYPDTGKFAVASRVPEDKGLMAARIAYVGRIENSLDYWEDEK